MQTSAKEFAQAAEISKLVRKTSDNAGEAVLDEAASHEVTAKGVRLVRDSRETFRQVTLQVASIEALVVGISQASTEQTQGVEQISTVVNENSAMVQEAMAAAQTLGNLADGQIRALSFFTVE